MSYEEAGPRSRQGPTPLTVEHQAERTAAWNQQCELYLDMRAYVERKFPELTAAQLDMFFASLVIENNLGEKWVSQNIVSPESGPARRDATSTFLRRSPIDSMERHERYTRIVELARRLFELGQEAFAESLITNLRRRDLEGAAFEADVIRMLVSLPAVLNLRNEVGVKGQDYDIDLWLPSGRMWFIEVKTRADTSTYRPARLRKTLANARQQLPSTGLGGIFMKIPTPWTTDPDYHASYENEVIDFLRNTSRVQAVVLVWDVWNLKPTGVGWWWERDYRIFRGPRIDDELDTLLTFYQRIWDNPHDVLAPNAPF